MSPLPITSVICEGCRVTDNISQTGGSDETTGDGSRGESRMSVSYSHGREFVAQVRPFLEARDFDGLVRHLHAYWSGRMLRGLLHCGHEDAAKVALVCIALTGSASDLPEVAPLLASDDLALASVAEHTMWVLWFRSGDVWAHRRMSTPSA